LVKLLLIDDDQELCELLQEYLTAEQFKVDVLYTGQNLLTKLHEKHYDLIILDVMLPDKDGFEVLRELRSQYNTSVLMLTAKGEDVDRIIGLELGADDYLAKPVNPRELRARIHVILRRSNKNTKAISNDGIIIGDLRLLTKSREVFQGQKLLELTSSEYNVLEVLLNHAGKIVSKKDLVEQALHKKTMAFDRSIDMHVSNLRNKLGLLTPNKPRIKTVRGIGYLYVSD
jgi:DNA-binding response OmpR family regulator